jgi:Uma2 family endonuclease
MGQALPLPRMTYPAYLALEAGTEDRHEYLRGEVWAMAGGSREHGRLIASLTVALGIALRGRPCAIHSSDVRVRVRATDRTTYPDLTVERRIEVFRRQADGGWTFEEAVAGGTLALTSIGAQLTVNDVYADPTA